MAYELEDVWMSAIGHFPDTKLLADLLRSPTPLPPNVRDLLAEYLDPEKPEIAGGRLVYEERLGELEKVLSLKGLPRQLRLAIAKREVSEFLIDPDDLRYRGWLAVAIDYYRLEKDADAVARLHNMNRRTVFRYVKTWERFAARLRGSDKKPG
jgi:hypothetical protein